jgi:hypothetical protein
VLLLGHAQEVFGESSNFTADTLIHISLLPANYANIVQAGFQIPIVCRQAQMNVP